MPTPAIRFHSRFIVAYKATIKPMNYNANLCHTGMQSNCQIAGKARTEPAQRLPTPAIRFHWLAVSGFDLDKADTDFIVAYKATIKPMKLQRESDSRCDTISDSRCESA